MLSRPAVYCFIFILWPLFLVGCGGTDSDIQPNKPIATPPDAPESLMFTGQVVEKDSFSVGLAWGKVEGATEYSVSYKASTDSDYSSIRVKANKVLLTGLNSGTYDWFVQAHNQDELASESSSKLNFMAGSQFKKLQILWNEFDEKVEVIDILPLSEGGFLTLYLFNSDGVYLLERSDAVGNVVWLQNFSSLPIEEGESIHLRDFTMTSSNHIVVVGDSSNYIDDTLVMQHIIVRLNGEGEVNWFRKFTESDEGFLAYSTFAAVATVEDDIYVAGVSSLYDGYYSDELVVWRFQSDSQAAELWSHAELDLTAVSPYPLDHFEMTSESEAVIVPKLDTGEIALCCGTCKYAEWYSCVSTSVVSLKVTGEMEKLDTFENLDVTTNYRNRIAYDDQILILDYDYQADAHAQMDYELEHADDDYYDDDWYEVNGPVDEKRFGFYYLDVCQSSNDCTRSYLDFSALPDNFFYKPASPKAGFSLYGEVTVPPLLVKSNSGKSITLLEVYLPKSDERREDETEWFQHIDYMWAELSEDGALTTLN